MKMWRSAAKHRQPSLRPGTIYNRILSAFMAIALIGSLFGGVANAADDVVNNVYISTSAKEPGKLYVDDNSIILNAYATMSITGDKLITDDATWSSTSNSVKVSKGVVTATGVVSSATITARYKDRSASFLVTAEHYFDELKLKINLANAPEKKEVELGQDLNLSVFGTRSSGGTEEEMTTTAQWTTSDSNVATVEKGKVKFLSAGEVKITAKSKGKSATIELKVTSPYKDIKFQIVAGKPIDGPVEMAIGGSDQQLIAIATLQSGGAPDTITEKATWTSSNETVVKVDEKGKLKAIGKGTAVITAKHNGQSGSLTIIVKTTYEALKVTPQDAIYMTLYGSSVQLKAEANNGKLGTENVTSLAEWKISDSDQAVAFIDKTGGPVLVRPNGVGTATINVSYLGLSKSINVTVFPTIESIDVGKDEKDVFIEDTGALPNVMGKTFDGESKDVSKLANWTSNNEAVVTIEDGKWKAVSDGTATLTAIVETAVGKPHIEASFKINVHKKILALIPSEESISVVIGKEVALPTVQLIYEDGKEMPISDKIVWKSSTPNLLVMQSSAKGLLAANATLTGTYLNKTVKIKVVVEEEFTSFSITPTKVSLTLNKSQSIKVIGTTKSGKNVTISSRLDWKPSSEGHVAVKGASVKGLTEGSGKLTATIQGKTLEVPYVVTAKLTKLTASETSFKSVVGNQLSVQVTALYENGKTENVTSQAVWSTSKASVATVADGKISVKGKGSATIKGVFGGKTVSVRVTVK
ncbi:Ig-like domain-containing protein [Cohnella terricola]|uniref:BIG2 domain-containing protein n=1 Tax=Cohnella terricola TaxID=1289167 RepID=A0A559JMN9_9BACL|nr:Ig-like domain-containing protein [Cohnella terricola]TVY01139.1 hypothetical protein FPZ45_08255 [Cohnella terricola]